MKPTSRPVLFAMMSAAMVTAEFVGGKAAREALFLTSLGFQALPAMLIAASACTLLVVAAHARWGARLAPSALIQILFAASGVLFLWAPWYPSALPRPGVLRPCCWSSEASSF